MLAVAQLTTTAKLDPRNGGPEINIVDGCAIIGRSRQNCSAVIAHKSVSRLHCKIAMQDNEWIVEDLDSTTGTRLNSKPIQKATLTNGDRLTVGPFRYRFVQESNEDSNALADGNSTTMSLPGVAETQKLTTAEVLEMIEELEDAHRPDVVDISIGDATEIEATPQQPAVRQTAQTKSDVASPASRTVTAAPSGSIPTTVRRGDAITWKTANTHAPPSTTPASYRAARWEYGNRRWEWFVDHPAITLLVILGLIAAGAWAAPTLLRNDRHHYDEIIVVYAQLNERRTHETKAGEWNSFVERATERLDAVTCTLERTATLDQPQRREMLYAARDYLPALILSAQRLNVDREAEENFLRAMRSAAEFKQWPSLEQVVLDRQSAAE